MRISIHGTTRRRLAGLALASSCVALLGAAPAAHAVTAAPGWALSFIETPGPATGDVAVVDGAVFVGVGSFGAGTQQVVRIDQDGASTLAEGFNSLAGFAYDPIGNRLVVGDNAGTLSGAVTGDTIYAITDPFGTPSVPAAAASLELLPSGSIPAISDLVFDPTDPSGDRLFVGDASDGFPIPEGRLIEVAIGDASMSVLRTDLLFTAGLAADAATLFLGDSQLDFSGRIRSVPVGSPDGGVLPVVSGLSGQFDLELAPDGSLLSTSLNDLLRFTSGGGSPTLVGSDFAFAAGLAVDENGVVYALDGAAGPEDVAKIWVFTPVPEVSTGWLLATALAVGGLQRRRRR